MSLIDLLAINMAVFSKPSSWNIGENSSSIFTANLVFQMFLCVLLTLSAFAPVGLVPRVPGWGCARVQGLSPLTGLKWAWP